MAMKDETGVIKQVFSTARTVFKQLLLQDYQIITSSGLSGFEAAVLCMHVIPAEINYCSSSKLKAPLLKVILVCISILVYK